ncbi:MAG: hypothetical protein JW958_01545 [Candidatus Eisenbacteria bacterium]|nr:hypothetical protein [Candidatus Eisenbacteria bacterium]
MNFRVVARRWGMRVFDAADLIGSALWGSREYARLVVVGHARTGTNYLIDGLTTSKHVRMYNEIFSNEYREVGRDFERRLRRLYRKRSPSVRCVGFKLFDYHLTDSEWREFLEHKEFKVIHQTRKNRLRMIVSLDIAFATNQWVDFDAKATLSQRRIRVETKDLLERIGNIEKVERKIEERFADRDTITVTYERLAADPFTEFRRIGVYLGVSDIDPGKIRMKRQNPEPLRDLILNYGEVEETLRDTPYANDLLS